MRPYESESRSSLSPPDNGTKMILAPFLLLLPTALPAPFSQEAAASDDPFPASNALAEEVSPEALERLSALVQSFVDDEEIVGGELLVIKNDRTILHEAYGWRDRESETPMETDSVFCVRSMTKPLIGASILMLADEKKLKLSDRASMYLPALDVDTFREITIEQLLHHTSGIPMSQIIARSLREIDGIQAVAELSAEAELEFAPGTDFNYSDQGTDTLTALVEVVSGLSAADFVTTRLLDPIGMRDSTSVMTEGHAFRERGCSKYVGARGLWTRFWNPEEPPLFPFFLGSQGLYSTTRDYARFMQFWRKRGRVSRERLLKPNLVRKALSPGPFAFQAGTGFPELRVDYGYLMQLWTAKADDGEREVVVYGHTGSDGTHAWVLPEQNAMVLYFTQSRNNMTGLLVEEAIGQLFLGAPFNPNEVAPPFDDYLGYYWEGEGDLYRAIVRDGDDLALEIMGKAAVPLMYAGGDRWKLRPKPSEVIVFDRSESGEVTGYHIGDHQEFRFEPSDELPSGAEVADLVAKTHRLDLMEELGPIRINSSMKFDKLGIQGESSMILNWPNQYRFDALVGDDESEQVSYDGEQVWYASKRTPAAQLTGQRAESLRIDNLLARFGDWTQWHAEVHVIQRLRRNGEDVFVVRCGEAATPATTMYVQGATGRILAVDGFIVADGMGRLGQHIEYGDFREVSGMLIPFSSETRLANPMIGTITVTVEGIELGVEVEQGAFRL